MARATERHICLGILLVFLLSINYTALAASSPEGFVGVPWGSSRSQIMQTMNELGWREAYNDGKSFYGSFAGFSGIITFDFTGNAMTGGKAELERATSGYNSKRTFDAAYKILSEKYGPAAIKSWKQEDRTSSLPIIYRTEWEIVDDVSSDKYWIMLQTIDALYMKDGTRLYVVEVYYANKSLMERKKRSEI